VTMQQSLISVIQEEEEKLKSEMDAERQAEIDLYEEPASPLQGIRRIPVSPNAEPNVHVPCQDSWNVVSNKLYSDLLTYNVFENWRMLVESGSLTSSSEHDSIGTPRQTTRRHITFDHDIDHEQVKQRRTVILQPTNLVNLNCKMQRGQLPHTGLLKNAKSAPDNLNESMCVVGRSGSLIRHNAAPSISSSSSDEGATDKVKLSVDKHTMFETPPGWRQIENHKMDVIKAVHDQEGHSTDAARAAAKERPHPIRPGAPGITPCATEHCTTGPRPLESGGSVLPRSWQAGPAAASGHPGEGQYWPHRWQTDPQVPMPAESPRAEYFLEQEPLPADIDCQPSSDSGWPTVSGRVFGGPENGGPARAESGAVAELTRTNRGSHPCVMSHEAEELFQERTTPAWLREVASSTTAARIWTDISASVAVREGGGIGPYPHDGDDSHDVGSVPTLPPVPTPSIREAAWPSHVLKKRSMPFEELIPGVGPQWRPLDSESYLERRADWLRSPRREAKRPGEPLILQALERPPAVPADANPVVSFGTEPGSAHSLFPERSCFATTDPPTHSTFSARAQTVESGCRVSTSVSSYPSPKRFGRRQTSAHISHVSSAASLANTVSTAASLQDLGLSVSEVWRECLCELKPREPNSARMHSDGGLHQAVLLLEQDEDATALASLEAPPATSPSPSKRLRYGPPSNRMIEKRKPPKTPRRLAALGAGCASPRGARALAEREERSGDPPARRAPAPPCPL